MRHRILILSVFAGAVFGAMQLVPLRIAATQAGDFHQPMTEALGAPPEVAQSLNRACGNCHSNETVWPWYSKVAPVSWLIAADVGKARGAVNFSEWRADRPYAAMGALTAACAAIQMEKMPPAPYRLMHPEARLSAAEVEGVCRWTASAAGRIMARSRRSR